jgi:peroxiredoxin
MNSFQNRLIILFFACAFGWQPLAGQAEEAPVLADFTLSNEEGNPVSLSDFVTKKAVVVVFTSSHCSWATQYEERLTQLYEEYAPQGVAVLAINANDATMSQRDESAVMRQITSYPFPYLKDEEQAVAKAFGATKNPEAFLLLPKDKGFEIVYQGKIDDNPLDPDMVEHPYLKAALDQVLAGNMPETISTSPSGCNIKWTHEE